MEQIPAYVLQVYNAYITASDRGDERAATLFRKQLDQYMDKYGIPKGRLPAVGMKSRRNPKGDPRLQEFIDKAYYAEMTGYAAAKKRASEAAKIRRARAKRARAKKNPQLMVVSNPCGKTRRRMAKKRVSKKPVTRKGITYWPTFSAARTYAKSHGHPTDRIIEYGLGWAIQLRKSGPYVSMATRQSPAKRGAAKRNPQLMVVSNPTAVKGVTKHAAKRAEKAYRRFHFTKPARMEEREIPSGWPKTYVIIGTCLRFVVKPKNGRQVARNYSGKNAPVVCTTAEMKDVYIFGDLKGVPSGTARQVDYRVPKTSKRRKWATDWTHDHDTGPKVTVHRSGTALKISGRGLKVTPRGIEG